MSLNKANIDQAQGLSSKNYYILKQKGAIGTPLDSEPIKEIQDNSAKEER